MNFRNFYTKSQFNSPHSVTALHHTYPPYGLRNLGNTSLTLFTIMDDDKLVLAMNLFYGKDEDPESVASFGDLMTIPKFAITKRKNG